MFEDRIPVSRPFFCLLRELRTKLDADLKVLELEREGCRLRGTKFRHEKVRKDLVEQWWQVGQIINGNPKKPVHETVLLWIKANLNRIPEGSVTWAREWSLKHAGVEL
jgi:hypothetical protein